MSLPEFSKGFVSQQLTKALLPTKFSKTDPRVRYACDIKFPQINFMINYCSISNPPVNVYTPDAFDAQVKSATDQFLNVLFSSHFLPSLPFKK